MGSMEVRILPSSHRRIAFILPPLSTRGAGTIAEVSLRQYNLALLASDCSSNFTLTRDALGIYSCRPTRQFICDQSGAMPPLHFRLKVVVFVPDYKRGKILLIGHWIGVHWSSLVLTIVRAVGLLVQAEFSFT